MLFLAFSHAAHHGKLPMAVPSQLKVFPLWIQKGKLNEQRKTVKHQTWNSRADLRSRMGLSATLRHRQRTDQTSGYCSEYIRHIRS